MSYKVAWSFHTNNRKKQMEKIKQEHKVFAILLLQNSQLQATKDGFKMVLLQLNWSNFVVINICSIQFELQKAA